MYIFISFGYDKVYPIVAFALDELTKLLILCNMFIGYIIIY